MAAKATIAEIREAAEADLVTFIRLVNPKQLLGSVHEQVCRWWTRTDALSHQMLLLPRDHQKSRLIAYRVVWEITRRPDIRILYISSTSPLAEKQLKFMQDILTSKIYRRYWPEMVEESEGKRERWTSSEIAVDHPKRKAELVRDPTILTGGLTTSLTGFHCDIAVLDDVVVQENAYTREGRDKVGTQYSLLSSIEAGDAQEWIVGTRYHPADLYGVLLGIKEQIFDDEGNVTDEVPVYEIFQREVEDRGDGTGEFLWPRQMRSDGKWFGFDRQILSRKRAKYIDKVQYRAQYYNNPNDEESSPVKRTDFQYYDRKLLRRVDGYWYYNQSRLNVYAALDLAYALTKRADYTALAVIGVDGDRNYYVLDVDRFKTDQIRGYFEKLMQAHEKWGFGKVRIEVTAAQQVVVQTLKTEFLKPHDVALSIDELRPLRTDGSKAERIGAILRPRYENGQIFHYESGNCQILEEELVMQNPPHDDVKDAVANAIDIAVAPTAFARSRARATPPPDKVASLFNSRFGGVQFR